MGGGSSGFRRGDDDSGGTELRQAPGSDSSCTILKDGCLRTLSTGSSLRSSSSGMEVELSEMVKDGRGWDFIPYEEEFDFADQYRGSYSDSLGSVACPFYCSYSGYHDELLWGAAWLHWASENISYMSYIQSNGHTLGAEDDDFSFSWDDKRVGTKVLLSKGFLQDRIESLQLYKIHADNYICSLVPTSPSFQAQYTPGGLLYKESESNLQYVTSTVFLLLTYSKYLNSNGGVATCGTLTITSATLISLAKRQVDYILGQNPLRMSYMVGFGDRYPLHVHHRGSSIPSVKAHPNRIGCNDGFSYLYSGSPNPNVLVGAVLGGPDSSDNFQDDRSNYQQSEPATYINAPIVGALAFLAGTQAS